MTMFKPGHHAIHEMIVQKKRLRIAALFASTLLYSALLTGLFLSPSPTDQFNEKSYSVIKMRAEMAATDRVISKLADEPSRIARTSAAKAKRGLPKPVSKPVTPIAVGQSGHRLSLTQPILLPQMAQTIPPTELDVTQIVASLINAQVGDDPLDFQVSENGTVSLSDDASTSASSPPLSNGPENSKADCAIAQKIQIALQNDTSMKQVLSQVPRSERSVANVIMAWDGDWVGVSNETALDPLGNEPALSWDVFKAHIQRHLGTIAPECLSVTVLGPEFILLDYGSEPTVLVFGSGAWRWADLVDPIAPADAGLTALLLKMINSKQQLH